MASMQHVNNDPAVEAEWDRFLQTSPRGHACQTSTWLHSFRAYGFRDHLIIFRDEKESRIVGGIGMVEVGRWPVNFIVAPGAPVVEQGYESLVAPVVESAIAYARQRGAMILQLRVAQPATKTIDFALPPDLELPASHGHARGAPFDVVIAPHGLLWINFPPEQDATAWEEALLGSFSSRTRRDVRKSLRSNLTIREAVTEQQLHEGFTLIQKNGDEQGYNTRTWTQFGPTIIEQVAKGHAAMLLAYHEEQLVGVHYGVVAGQRYTYFMGGAVRLTPDRNVGHFMQWNAMKKAHSLGLRGYDIYRGGNESVLFFKMGFQPDSIEFQPLHYYVLSPWRFRILQNFWPRIKRNKAKVARLLESFRGRRGQS